MARSVLVELELGVEIVQRLLPHRPPMLMVDSIDAISGEPGKMLWSSRTLRADDLWLAEQARGSRSLPPVLALEGLAQSAGLLGRLLALGALDQDAAAIELAPWLDRVTSRAVAPLGALAAARVRFHAPAFAGERLAYEVRFVRKFGPIARFDGTVVANGRLVATGAVDLARLEAAAID